MFNFKEIQAGKKEIIKNDLFESDLKTTITDFLKVIAEIEYKRTIDENKLKDIANKFLDLLEKRKNVPELYYFLAIIFCMFNKPEFAKSYYLTGQEKFPEHNLFKNSEAIKALVTGG